jgi:hypothetical protein
MDNPEELTTLGTQDEGRTTQYEKNMFLKVNQKSVLRHWHGLLDLFITEIPNYSS